MFRSNQSHLAEDGEGGEGEEKLLLPRFQDRSPLDQRPLNDDPLDVRTTSSLLTKELRSHTTQADGSVTVESVASLGAAPTQPGPTTGPTTGPTEANQASIKPERGGQPSTPRNLTARTTSTRIKREDEDAYDVPEQGDEMMVDDRVNLAELHFPGGQSPVNA